MVKTFDPKQCIITYGGVQLSGFADGTFLSIVPNAESFTRVVGADGEVARNKSNDSTYNLTMTFLASSASNDYLSTVYLADKVSNSGSLPFTVADLSGTTVFFTESCWIQQAPDVEFAKEITERAWALQTGQADEYFIGGNN